MKYKICPKCGLQLEEVHINIGDKNIVSVCTDSCCRTVINGGIISELDIASYAELQQRYNLKKHEDTTGLKAYMLLKEDLSAPLMVKETRDPLDRNKSNFCIVRAISKEEAFSIFSKQFKYINVTYDMIVEVRIKEIEQW